MQVWKALTVAGLILAGIGAPAVADEKPPISSPYGTALGDHRRHRAAAVARDRYERRGGERRRGGINGSKLEILRYDDQLRPDQAVLRIREAMNAGAVGIIGPVSGTQWETAVPLVNKLKFPALNINASKAGIMPAPGRCACRTMTALACPRAWTTS